MRYVTCDMLGVTYVRFEVRVIHVSEMIKQGVRYVKPDDLGLSIVNKCS